MRTEAQRFDLFHYCADEPTPGPSQEGYLFSPVGASRCSGPRTVPVRSGSSGARTAEFSGPLLTSDALRTGTVRGPFARAATSLNRHQR